MDGIQAKVKHDKQYGGYNAQGVAIALSMNTKNS